VLDKDCNNNKKEKLSTTKCQGQKHCACIDAWYHLKQIFEITNEEIDKTNQINYIYPDDTFLNLQIDLENDECGDNLEHFRLDGDYLINDLHSLNFYDKPYIIKTNEIANENKSVLDDHKEDPIRVEQHSKITFNPEVNQNSHIKYNDTKTKETMDITNNKNILFNVNDKFGSKNNKNVNTTQRAFKSFKKRSKCCSTVRSSVDNQQNKKENNIQYLYTFGELYRGGINCGHKNCIDCLVPIPQDRGWISEEYISSVSS